MTFEVMHGNYPLMPNKTLSSLIDEELNMLGGITYNEEEMLSPLKFIRHY